ncbi:double-strand break repair protein MRE11 [Microplitis demolitor]|uniref:double-strand break repair protein MRE11 n=1 Tax=Microplitis demolitor TaxID=69319 RepID=UPI0004CD9189|nr:double-strand break repair protein MRE11 [Microplitis demolitor]
MSIPDSNTSQPSSDNIFKILLATDCHLGYEERASKKSDRNDSFTTFEEILQIALAKKVDFILLGGDLFHDSTPSQNVVLKCINLLKKYCFGERTIKFWFLSDPSETLSNPTGLNFENENLNVGLPIFTVHGNHDNPSFEYTSTLDILAASGLVNYFGKSTDLSHLTVSPMVFRKGDTYVAIYGISFIGDQRLSRLFKNGLVTFLRPKNIEHCVNILVLHQNRAKHTRHGFISEDKLPSFFDLIFWGHEHECRLIPEEITLPDGEKYYITQPGSSVATSLAEGEAKPKHVGLLKIDGTRFIVKDIKLQTVRPFVFDSLNITDLINRKYCDSSLNGILEYVDDYIQNTMLPQVKKLLTGHPNQPTIPFLRLKLTYHDDSQQFDPMLITRKYCDTVANAKDLILFRRDRATQNSKQNIDFDVEDAAADLAECFQHESDQDWSLAVQNEIERNFIKNDENLRVLSLLGMNEALDRCVKANDNEAFLSIFNYQVKKTLDHFINRQIKLNRDDYDIEVKKFRSERLRKNTTDEMNQFKELLNDREARNRLNGSFGGEEPLDDLGDLDTEDDPAPVSTPVTTRGRGRARGTRAKTTTRATTRGGRGRAASGSSARSPLTITTQTQNNQPSNQNFDQFLQPSSQFTTSTQRPAARKPTQFYNSDSD